MITHTIALIIKNFYLWKRDLRGTFCEVLVPLIFVFLLYIFKSQASYDHINQQSYIDQSIVLTPGWDSSLVGIEQTIKDCTSSRIGGKVGLAPKIPLTEKLQSILESILQFDLSCKFLYFNQVSQLSKKMSKQHSLLKTKEHNTQSKTQIKILDKQVIKFFLNYLNQIDYPDIKVEYFKSKDEFDDHITSSDYPIQNPPQICFGILFESWENGIYDYTLSYNITESYDIPRKYRTDYIDFEQNDQFKKYINSGFTRIVNWIDNIILQLESGDPSLQIQPKITIMQTESFTKTNLYEYAGNLMNIFLIIPMIIPFLRLSSRILHEKEKRIREGMMMMGLGKIAFYMSWIFSYLSIFALISLIVSSALKVYFFTSIDFTVLYVIHFTFSCCLLSQSLFITVFFDKQRTGIIGATFLFLFFFLLTFNDGDSETSTNEDYQSMSIFAAPAFSQAARLLVIYQSRNDHVSMDMLGQTCNRSSLIYSINSSWINFVVFFVLFLYLDQVIANEFGQRKHWLFFIGCSINSSIKQNKLTNNQNLMDNYYIEEVDISLKKQEMERKTIKIQGLIKQFKSDGKIKIAVNQLNLEIYSGQVFSFLGHNGAGKSTTISMLTGMIPPSSGTAYVKGYDIQKDMSEIRSIIGVCPQHDILFDSLTVKEHLYLFAILKGVSLFEVTSTVNKIIKEVDLEEKANSLSCSLSGGQKRKLSVGIAFIGESEVILLDEPTSGMDVQARRHVWDMIKNNKQQKIIILTTHFMDEADYLGDRIGIISDGQIKCVGSNVFLKERFGNGYNFTFVKDQNNSPSEPIIQLMKGYFPESNLISDISSEIAFQVPYKYIPSFQTLFDQIEKQKQKLKIRSYGVSITTLEEVFLKVASLNDNHIVQTKKLKIQENKNGKYNSIENINKDLEDFSNQDDLNMSERVRDPLQLFFIHLWALIKKRLHYFKRDKKGLCCELILPILLISFGLLMAYLTSFSDFESYKINPDIFFEENPKVYYGSSMSQSTFQSIINKLGKYDGTSYTFIDQKLTIQQFDEQVFQKKTTETKFAYYLEKIEPTYFEYTAFVNTVSLDGIPMSIHLLNNAIINQIVNKNIKINITNQPLKLTSETKKYVGVFQGFNAALFFGMGVSFIPASIISFIVRERQEHVKHQQIVSGVSLKAYWISNFIIDYIKFLIPCISSTFLAYAFKIDSITGDGNFNYIILLFIFYGLALLPLVYLFSFLHKDYGNAQIIQFFFHFIFGGVGACIFAILRFFESTRDFALKLQWVMRIMPSFSMYYGFTNLTGRKYIQLANELDQLPSQMDLDVMGGDLMFLILSFFVYTGVLILIETYRNRKSILGYNLESKYPYQKPSNIDSDVDEEMQDLLNKNPSDYTVLVRNLRKVFPPTGGSNKEKPKVAVNNLNFGVKTGDIFCFLGVNGAGKTTTMRMLTGDETIGSGEAYIKGYKIPDQISESQQFIGYCPQFDALLDNLTAREHLELFASIKGIPKNQIESIVSDKLDQLNLRKFENVVARTYSGGNKRKLSVAIAMLGNPPIAFLDEPSTGMDPGNRRFMWNVINDIATNQKKTSIILTTHSMEEAEALGTKVGIVVGGQFECMGSIQHLKNKFGKGYEVSLKTTLPSMEQILALSCNINISTQINKHNISTILAQIGQNEFISEIAEDRFASQIYHQIHSKKQNYIELQIILESIFNFRVQQNIKSFFKQNFDGYEILENFNNYIKIRVQSNQTLGYLFGVMSQSTESLKISSYTICQTSLEQIFHDIANSKNKNHNRASSLTQNSQDEQKKINQFDKTRTSIEYQNKENNEFKQTQDVSIKQNSQILDIKNIQIRPNYNRKRN